MRLPRLASYLLEILLVLVIIVLLIAMWLPAYIGANPSSGR
jgi:hypothetical protein